MKKWFVHKSQYYFLIQQVQKSVLPIFSCILLLGSLHAQEKNNKDSIDISQVEFAVPILNYEIIESPELRLTLDSKFLIPSSESKIIKSSQNYPQKNIGKPIYIQFHLTNHSDTTQNVFFSPGIFFTGIEMFSKIENLENEFKSQFSKIKPFDYSSCFREINIAANKEIDLIAKLTPLKSGVSLLSPIIINKGFLPHFEKNMQRKPINMLSYFVSGILMMMLLYSISIFFQDYKSDFFYYSLYTFFTGLLFFLKGYLYNENLVVNYFFEGWLDFTLQCLGFIFYISFIRKFLCTSEKYPVPEKIFKTSQRVIVFLVCLFSFVYFFLTNYFIPNIIESVTKVLLIAIGIYFVIYFFPRKNKMINFLIIGHSLLIVFSIISYFFIFHEKILLFTKYPIFNEPIFYYEAGTTIELIFFLIALTIKNKEDLAVQARESSMLKMANQTKELEKQMAIADAKNDERNRIAEDMHDELGSGVTAIRLMSEIIKFKIKKEALPEIEKISQSANELLDKMNTIIWTMNSSNNTVDSLIAYIRAYAIDFFENTMIKCKVNILSIIPAIEISGEKRRNIFLAIKEALNNALKHSNATNVIINIRADKMLAIEIFDNGIGFDKNNSRVFGNGINNMSKRMENIGGCFSITECKGTKLLLTLEL